MSFKIAGKFAQAVPEDLEDHRPVQTTTEPPAGDYTADVTPPAPEDHLDEAIDSGEEVESA